MLYCNIIQQGHDLIFKPSSLSIKLTHNIYFKDLGFTGSRNNVPDLLHTKPTFYKNAIVVEHNDNPSIADILTYLLGTI